MAIPGKPTNSVTTKTVKEVRWLSIVLQESDEKGLQNYVTCLEIRSNQIGYTANA